MEAKGPFDVLLSDIGLPDRDGCELVAELRRRPEWRDKPALAISAYALPEDRERALKAGFDGFVTKPVDPDKLIDSINAHYDHRRLLPADQNTANTQTNLVTTSDIGSAAGRIVITMGCHSGVSVSDLIPNLLGADWDQTYAAQGALGYIANTGFGLTSTTA